MTITSYDITTSENQKPKKWKQKSPYLGGDKIQLLSKVSGKKIVHKKMLDYVSSFPLAANIYKTNSDELKSLKRPKKKNKKSVLTLPNNPAQVPQMCTASDMNDSEYTGQSIDCKQPKIKKRSSIKNVRKPRPKRGDYEYYDRDARFCSQLNILETSSTDFFKQYRDDGKIQTKSKKEDNEDLEPHGVWAVLRNMNRFQFTPSPPLSEDSIITLAKNKKKKRRNRKDGSFIETRTEEYAYISSFSTVDDGNHSLTQSSSFDRLTVINKQDDFTMCQEFQETCQSKFALKDTKDNQKLLQPTNKKDRKKTKNDYNMKALCIPAPNKYKADSHNYITQNWHNEDNSIINDDNILDITIKHDKSQNTDHRKKTSVCNKTNDTTAGCILNCHKAGSMNNGKSVSRKSTSDTPTDGRIVSRLKGVSRHLLGKTCEPSVKDTSQVTLRRPPVQNRKTRLVTTMPSACTMPKLTASEINTNKLLLKYRFPIVILGKDQLSSTIEVPNYDPPQFNGLDQHIWPFMVEWNKKKKSFAGNKSNSVKGYNNLSNKKTDYDIPTNRHCNKPKKNISDHMNDNKTELKMNGEAQQSKKKSIALLKEKMLNLLYKKIADRIIISDENRGLNVSENKTGEPGSVHISKYKANTNVDTQIKDVVRQPFRSKVNTSFSILNKNTQQCEFRHPWAKAKWANDFVDNVIKKIENGVYYSQDHNQVIPVTDGAAGIDHDEDSEHDLSPKVRIMKKLDVPDTLPGFENSLPEMEFKILNMNEITVKHCITNITMQFDVTIPAKPHNQIIVRSTTASKLIPIKVTESHAKVLKCQKSILNAILPAELCSILPKLVKLIQPTDLHSNACAGVIDKCVISPPCLSPIAEASRCDLSCNRVEPLNKKQLSWRSTSSALNNLLNGIFSNGYKFKINSKKPVQIRINPVKSNHFKLAILSPELIIQHTDIIYFNLIRLFIPQYTHVIKNEITITSKPGISYSILLERQVPCVALELYTTKNKRLVPAFKSYNFTTFITDILKSFMNIKMFWLYNILNMQYQQKILNLCVNTSNDQKVNNVTISIKNLKIDSLFFKAKAKYTNFQNDSETKCIEYIKRSTCEDPKKKYRHFDTNIKAINNKKNKRRGFFRLYRKCKSTSNIPTPEKCNTPLNKIFTLEDFCQIISTKGMLSSVFDDYTARKILTSIAEMSNWISDINPRQALLVLLLSNKKETPNLVRFRPIILQGIAVNRITKATELDMEIEVIERENLNKFSQHDGISYLPENVENQNQLLEELYWIAKTTASDYQRPFDESSEKHLKSLLEKRRKLNPSYLRVMARYVGLGLLKPSKK